MDIYPYHFERSADLNVSIQVAFRHFDDFEALGAHMRRSSWRTAGTAMRYEFDAARGLEVGALVRISGSILGLKLHIEERVVERSPPTLKIWETVGSPRMLVLAGYRLGFRLASVTGGTRLTVFIDYAKPQSGSTRWLGALAGDSYARWCVSSMISDGLRHFGA